MKKRILFLGFLLMIFGLQLSAQTLKNIHRHNQPVLRIPTHLIDKVETADVQGAPHFRVVQFNGYVSEIPLAQIDSITHSVGEAVDPAQLGNLRTASVMGVVTGTTGVPVMNAIVRSPYGGEETRTDPNGVFFLNNILVFDKLGYITITKPGFHQGSRSFLPLETGSNRVNVQLLPMTQSGTFSAASGGTVTSGLLQLNFPANAIIRSNGQPYTGTVLVYAAALDPTSTTMFDQMPGELLGGLNDSLRLLRSFGMASVELRDASMNELQLATGVSATLRFNIPTALQAEAPETIDWWSFDENLGYWKHEGEAAKQDTQYVAQASHFSWWNCDVPQNFNDLHGLVNTSDGTPISDAQVNVVSPTLGTGVTYTNAVGEFSGRVPKNQQLTLTVLLMCNNTNDLGLAHSEMIVSQTQPILIAITTSLIGNYPVTGTIVDCFEQPVENGYVIFDNQVYQVSDLGQFTIQACSVGEYYFRGYDTSNADSIKASALDTVQLGTEGTYLGNLQACQQFSSTVSDNDGNIYSTVLIGNQLWMAQNLRTSFYANGEPIPNVTDNSAWITLSSGAWCHYNNDIANELILGKLYNWYTVVDSRGLCPDQWHVPTDNEWTSMIEFLGGESIAGGKMKALTGWVSPNLDATNESGFTGLSGGIRSGNQGSFLGEGELGYWWSHTGNINDSESAWGRIVYYYMGYVDRNYYNILNGISIRCIKD